MAWSMFVVLSVLPALLEWNLGVSGVGWVLAHCWALRNQAAALCEWWVFFWPLRTACPGGVGGRGGRGSCELDSGREHLWQLFT